MTVRARSAIVAALLVTLALVAGPLALSRIYQVDEAQNVFMSRVVATGQTDRFFTTAQLWLLGPLSWVTQSAGSAVEMFRWSRLIFLCVFVGNAVLLAAATGTRLTSNRGLFTLVGAATLAPLWDYGFEIRHDNLVLAGLLLSWLWGRARPGGARAYAALGALAVLLGFIAMKAVAYVLPLSIAFIAWPPPGHRQARARLALAWALGAVGAFALVALLYGRLGLWTVFLAGFRWGVGLSTGAARFPPWETLGRMLTQTPLLLSVTAAGLTAFAVRVLRAGRAALRWDGHGPEALLFLGSLGVLWANPAPFPYNLVNVVPFAFLLAARFLDDGLEGILRLPGTPVLAIVAVLLGHTVPFFAATARHFGWSNARQELLMRSAEALTDPATDRVYDAIGMVPSRSSIHFDWFLHSLTIRSLVDGRHWSVRQMLTDRPAAVLIPSYRTDWLPGEDRAFIRARYIPLADDFWVLGSRLPPGGGRFEIVHPGRYQILTHRVSSLAPATSATLDGLALPDRPVLLGPGDHVLTCALDVQGAVVWVGPRLDRVPDPGHGEHTRLFVNWY